MTPYSFYSLRDRHFLFQEAQDPLLKAVTLQSDSVIVSFFTASSAAEEIVLVQTATNDERHMGAFSTSAICLYLLYFIFPISPTGVFYLKSPQYPLGRNGRHGVRPCHPCLSFWRIAPIPSRKPAQVAQTWGFRPAGGRPARSQPRLRPSDNGLTKLIVVCALGLDGLHIGASK